MQRVVSTSDVYVAECMFPWRPKGDNIIGDIPGLPINSATGEGVDATAAPPALMRQYVELLKRIPGASKNAPRAAALMVVQLLRHFPPGEAQRLLADAGPMFSLAQEQWHRLHSTLLSGHSSWEVANLAHMLRFLQSAPPTAVASLGCGDSLLNEAAELRAAGVQIGDGATLVGVDLVKCASEEGRGVFFRQASSANTGLADSSMQLVQICNALYNHEELQPTATEMIRISAVNGLISIVMTFELHLVDEMVRMLIEAGIVLECQGQDRVRRWAVLRKVDPVCKPVPGCILESRYSPDLDYTIVYTVHIDNVEVDGFVCEDAQYIGSHGPNAALLEHLDPVQCWQKKRWKQHLSLLLADNHHSGKFQKAFNEKKRRCPEWRLLSKEPMETPTPTVSQDGLKLTYVLQDNDGTPLVTIEATKLAPNETSRQALLAMLLREGNRILEKKIEGGLCNASLVVGMVDLDACAVGGVLGGARATHTPRPHRHAPPRSTRSSRGPTPPRLSPNPTTRVQAWRGWPSTAPCGTMAARW